jgi:hypothetical protein
MTTKNETFISALTGQSITLEEFTTINKLGTLSMKPSSNITGDIPIQSNTTRNLEMNGIDEYNTKKMEQEPFFQPKKNISYVNGSPSSLVMQRERMYTTEQRRTELPFEKIRVGPQIGGNYTDKKGKGGFQQFETQELMRPKNIDQLRGLNNQRETFKGRIIKGKNVNSARPINGKVSKNRTEKLFNLGKDRFGGKNASVKQQKAKENFVARFTNRQHSREFIGVATGDVDKHTAPINVQDSNKNIYAYQKPSNKSAQNKWHSNAKLSDYGKEGFVARPNERDITQKRTVKSNIVSVFKALIAPITDKIKTTKKQELEENNRPEGNFSVAMPNKLTVYDPNDIARTTIKETLIHNDREGIVSGPQKLTVYDPNDVARTTIKETTIYNDRKGIANGEEKGQHYNYESLPKITIRNTLNHVDTNVNLNPNRPEKNTQFSDQPIKTTIKQTTIDSKHAGQPVYNKNDGYLIAKSEAPNTNRQFTSNYEYTGNAHAKDDKPTSYDASYNARLNNNKEIISKGRTFTNSGSKTNVTKSDINILHKKQMGGTRYRSPVKSRDYIKTSSETPVVLTQYKDNLGNKTQVDRIEPSILNAFKENPYTQSLSSFTNALPVGPPEPQVPYIPKRTPEQIKQQKIKEELAKLD